ncbi:nitrous oxide reductase family maturation protein NosD [Exiguobacterium sp. S22-S28]|uniref:right-handed parallel beta-helix repeat-containing protein n=1 Tax=Exiguobacterium sp. S22-S28 TaxID=3342768 RepID=UPI00372CF1F3
MRYLWMILLIVALSSPSTISAEQHTVVQKSISLHNGEHFDGQGQTFISCNQPAFQINGTDVQLTHVHIKMCPGTKHPAILMKQSSGSLHHISIDTSNVGIQMTDGKQVDLQDIRISGTKQKEGIALFDGQHISLEHIQIKRVRDGIYVEGGKNITMKNVETQQSRYGIHLMFPRHVSIDRPQMSKNQAGAMIMGTTDVTVSNGRLLDQKSASGNGFMLFDAKQTVLRSNHVTGNRVGIYAEKSEDTKILNNDIQGNVLGFQMKQANGMTISKNDVRGNRYPVTMIDSADNQLEGNDWGSQTLDLNGDGISEMPYRSVSVLADRSI